MDIICSLSTPPNAQYVIDYSTVCIIQLLCWGGMVEYRSDKTFTQSRPKNGNAGLENEVQGKLWIFLRQQYVDI